MVGASGRADSIFSDSDSSEAAAAKCIRKINMIKSSMLSALAESEKGAAYVDHFNSPGKGSFTGLRGGSIMMDGELDMTGVSDGQGVADSFFVKLSEKSIPGLTIISASLVLP